MRGRFIAGPLLGMALLALPGHGVEPDEVRIRYGPYSAFRLAVQSDLVEVGVTVRDRHGAAVAGLQAADFEVQDRHKPQAITFFSMQKAPEPAQARGTAARSIGLFFDDTHAAAYDLQKARLAAEQLVSTELKPNDRVAIFTGSGSPMVDFTDDRKALDDALAALRLHHLPGPASLGICPDYSPYAAFAVAHGIDPELTRRLIAQAVACNCAGGDPGCIEEQAGVVDAQARQFWDLFKKQSSQSLDAIRSAVQRLAAAPGTRILVMFSPGFMTGDLDARKSSIVDAALHAHIVISSLNAAGLKTAQSRGADVATEFMSSAAHSTGGQFVQNTNDAAGGLERLTAIPEVSYVLGFSPDVPRDGKFRPLRVSLRQKTDYQIEARSGYFAPSPVPAKPTVQERIDQAVRSQESLEEITAHMDLLASGVNDGPARVQVRISVDANTLKFTQRDGRHIQQLTFVTLVEDAQGTPISGKQSVMDLRLKPATLADLRAKGLRAEASFTLPKGAYRIREVVRESVDSRLWAGTTPLELR